MPGPRAPVGTLSQHAANAAGLRDLATPGFRSLQNAKQRQIRDDIEEEDDTSSSSDSDISDDDDNGKDAAALLAKINSTSATWVKKGSGFASPEKAHSAKPSGLEEKSKRRHIAINTAQSTEDSDSSSDSSSNSESESSSESSSAGQVKPKTTAKVLPKEGVQSSNFDGSEDLDDSEDSEDSEESRESQESESEGSEESESDGTREVRKMTQSDLAAKPAENNPRSAGNSTKRQARVHTRPSTVLKGNGAASDGLESDSTTSNDDEAQSRHDDSEYDSGASMAVEMRNRNATAGRFPQVDSQDFHLRKAVANHEASEIADFLKDAQKQGKQIWYFTAPESVPIEVIQEHAIPLDRVKQGHPILTHNGDDYGVGFDTSTTTSINIVIPTKNGASYELLKRPVDQTIHLKRMTRFGQSGEASVAVTQSHTATVTPRPQPPGLKARYLPIGVTTSIDSDDDIEMTLTASQATNMPTSSARRKKDKKRKHASTNDEISSPNKVVEEVNAAKKARLSESSQPHRVTPILPPSVPSYGGLKTAPAATPSSKGHNVTSSPLYPLSSVKSAANTLPRSSTQPIPGKRETQVPLPSHASRSTLHASPSPAPAVSTPAQKSKKPKDISKKSKGNYASAAHDSLPERRTVNDIKEPRKETPILPPTPGNQA